MKYCCENHQRVGTCYFEFQPGLFDGQFWMEESIYLSAELFDQYELRRLFRGTLPAFDYYGMTSLSQGDWENIKIKSLDTQAEGPIEELGPWMGDCFERETTVTILGI